MTWEELFIGKPILNISSNQISVITELTTNSICVYDLANKKNKDKDGKLMGIDSKSWYDLTWFNRKYKNLTYEDLEDKFMPSYIKLISSKISNSIKEENFKNNLPITYFDYKLNAVISEYKDGKKEIIKQL